MHIAQIAPLTESIPPRLYGGTERVVGNLCDALVQLGHQVTLFAAAEMPFAALSNSQLVTVTATFPLLVVALMADPPASRIVVS